MENVVLRSLPSDPRARRTVTRLLPLLAVAAVFGATAARAQEDPSAAEQESAAAEERESFSARRTTDPRVPRGAAYSFLDACRAGDYQRAATFLNLSALPARERAAGGPVLARHLMVVMDRKLWADFGLLSDQPQGDLEDGLEATDVVGTIQETAKGPVDVQLERVEDEDGTLVWKFSAATVAQVPDLYDEFGYGALGTVLPDVFFVVRLLDVQLWQWIGILVLVFAAWLLSWLAARLVLRILRPLAARTKTELDDRILALMAGPIRLVFAVFFFSAGTLLLGLVKPAEEFLQGLELAAIILAVTWFLLRLMDVFGELIAERLTSTGRISVTTVIPLGRRAAKVVVLLLAMLAMLQNLGFNVTGILAGLGVGGLAVALAAQKSIENLFGGVTLVADRPVQVGDFCRFGDQIGTVEDVGIRSTRVRTLDRTVITIPNADFSQMLIENFARRDRIRLFTVIGLRYETTPDQLRYVLAGLRRMLLAHPRVLRDPARVRFIGFGASSLDLEVFAYVDTSDWNEFLGVREDVYLRIMDVVEESGTGFAFPSQTFYRAEDSGLDPEKSAAAERTVQTWRREGTLPFPFFSEATLEEVENTLDFPPEGSALKERSPKPGPGTEEG